jgi:hypothetical protein
VSPSPRYPIYIPSKGRYTANWTAKCLKRDGVPFQVVVESQEADHYTVALGAEHVLVLPFSNLGLGSIPARNWIKDHATAAGHDRHWQLDDNITDIKRRYQGKRIPCHAGIALSAVEDFTDRYENVALTGLNYEMFLPNNQKAPPFTNLPHYWRGRYNEDTDLCLQVLADGWCTVLVNAFFIWKKWTMQVQGGNTAELYKGDGRLHMARSLERMWPGVVTTQRRFKRPQHVIKDSWRYFDTPLKLKPGIDLEAMTPNEYGMKLQAVKPVKSPELQRMLAEAQQTSKAPG